MRTNIIVVDDFYANPDSVRAFALQQNFDILGNYPGKRTKSFLTNDVKEAIEKIVNIPVIKWFEESYTGSFQIALKDSITWIHTDHFNNWAGVLYLTPNAPSNAGTGLYLHKPTNSMTKKDDPNYVYDTRTEDYELYDVIANKYNRLILFRSDIFHDAQGYFGDSLENGRLFQLFFFNTSY